MHENYKINNNGNLSKYTSNQHSITNKSRRFKLGEGCILIIGDWTAVNGRFHEPVYRKGLGKMLKEQELPAYLIDKFNISSFCPQYKEKLKVVPNPRPYRSLTRQFSAKYHGLLRCKPS